MKKGLFYLFILLAFAQWLIPAKMLLNYDAVRTRGKTLKFQTQPVDPVHPFKGRYVALNFTESRITVPQPHSLHRGQKVYVVLKNNAGGYAEIDHLLKKEPLKDIDYIKADVEYINDWTDSTTSVIELKYPFDEYFMEEYKAPEAEKLYGNAAVDTDQTYAVVKIYKGEGVIEGLFINNTPVEELIEPATK